MHKKYYKNFKIISGVLILGLFVPFILPFTAHTANALDPLPTKRYNPDAARVNLLPAGQSLSDLTSGSANARATGNTNRVTGTGTSTHPFTDGTAERLVSATAGCGAIAERFTRIITNLETEKKAKITFDQVNSLAVQLAKPTADIIKALSKAGTNTTPSESTTKDEEAIAELKKLNDEAAASAKREEQRVIWEQCLSGIAYKLAKSQLAFMTQSIVNWVNTGFGGDPLFIRDRDAFFSKIGTDSLQTFLTPLTDPTLSSLYPYGKDVAKILIKSSRSTFATRAQNTLSSSLPTGVTAADYQNDFAKGGWSAWLSQTQNDANNPLGFGLIAMQEASRQKEQDIQEKKDELVQGKGFLSVTKCVEYKEQPKVVGSGSVEQDSKFVSPAGKTVTLTSSKTTTNKNGFSTNIFFSNLDMSSTQTPKPQLTTGKVIFSLVTASGGTLASPIKTVNQSNGSFDVTFDGLTQNVKYVLNMSYSPTVAAGSTPTPITIAKFNVSISPNQAVATDPLESDCLRREITTPGSIVADQLSTVLNSPVRQLELAHTVDQSLDSVFSAMVNQLTTNGFSSLSNYTQQQTGTDQNSNTGVKYYDNLNHLISVNPGYGGWLNQGDVEFDITRDLGDVFVLDKDGNKVMVSRGVISTQDAYITAATNTRASLVPILSAIGNLDYCIPGPNPNWKEVAMERVDDMKNYIGGQSYDGKNLQITPAWANAAKTTAGAVAILAVIVPVGTIIAAVVGIGAQIYDAIQSSKNARNQIAANDNLIYGKKLFYDNISAQLKGIDKEFEDYSNYIDSRYGAVKDKLPMASEGLDITKNISTYAANITESDIEYATQIDEAKINIQKLKSLKIKVDAIVTAARARRNAKIQGMIRDALPNAVNFCPGIIDPASTMADTATGAGSNLGGNNGTGIN